MASPSPLLLLLLLLLLPLISTEDNNSCSDSGSFKSSKAVYSTYTNFRGACGYYEYGATVNHGLVTGVGKLYKNGRGCGACYLIHCTDKKYCDPEGITVVVTDQGYADAGVDFVLSQQAFAALAYEDFGDYLLDRGILAIEYRRVSCEYPKQKLQVKVMEQSVNPGYLAIIFLYQAGAYDILDVEVLPDKDKCEDWMPMRRAYGTVWDLENSPTGALKVKLLLGTDDAKVKWVNLGKVIPDNWKPGKRYDTDTQLSSISMADSS